VILRSNIRSNGAQLADYLQKQGENELVEVFDVRGTTQSDNLRKSLIEMSLSIELSGRTKKGLYHVVINPRPSEDKAITKEQWFRAAEIIEEQLGFTGQKRVMVMHKKEDRFHMHVVFERFCHETGLVISNRHSHRRETKARRIMEQEFGHALTAEKNLERVALKKLLGELWAKHSTGKEFLKAVEKAGYIIAREEGRRPYAIVNSAGRSFELVKEIPKVRTRQVRERLKGIHLPDKNQVIDAIREQQKSRPKRKTRDQIINELQKQTRDTEKNSKGRGR
jgi:phosphohistidine swiveling domain-containing protein/uncharacterized DUF497 family protein